jgi:hypothetical protein
MDGAVVIPFAKRGPEGTPAHQREESPSLCWHVQKGDSSSQTRRNDSHLGLLRSPDLIPFSLTANSLLCYTGG